MAVLILNSSTCAICNQVLASTDSVRGFPHFMANLKDELSFISDAGVHTNCYNTHPLKNSIEVLIGKHETSLKQLKEHSYEEYHSGNVIALPAFTSHADEPIYQFNFAVIKLNDPLQKNVKDAFLREAKLFLEKGKWEQVGNSNTLKSLILRMSV